LSLRLARILLIGYSVRSVIPESTIALLIARELEDLALEYVGPSLRLRVRRIFDFDPVRRALSVALIDFSSLAR
jgi:hypothetical protein